MRTGTKLVILSLLISGCAGQGLKLGKSNKPTVPQREDARQACPTKKGTVLEVTEVTIQGNNTAAQATGGALGGYIGYIATSEPITRALAMLVGAGLGAWGGDKVGKNQSRDGQELVVFVEGETFTILQETDDRMGFSSGDDVWVIGNINENRRNSETTNTYCKNGIRVIQRF